MKSIAVIGAGMTGMTAAFWLKHRQFPVEVYEISDQAGGVIRSIRNKEGYLAETASNTILNTSEKIAITVRTAGVANRMITTSAAGNNRFLVRYGRPIMMGQNPVAFFLSPLFSWKAKLHLMQEPFRKKWQNKYEETVADFVRRRFDEEFLTYAINPLVAGIYAGDPEKLSVIHGFPKLYKAEQNYGSLIKAQFFGARERKKKGETSKQDARIFSFDDGLQVLPIAMSKRVGNGMHCHSKVTKISRLKDCWKVTYIQNGKILEKEHSAVLITVPAYVIKDIQLESNTTLSFSTFSEIHYAPISSVVLGFKRTDVQHSLNGFGMLIPKIEGFKILGTLFNSSMFKERAPHGFVTLTTYIGGMRYPEFADLPQDELVRMALEDMTKLLKITGEPTFMNVNYHPLGIPQYEVGYGRYKDHISLLEKELPGLYIGGSYTKGISLSDNLLAGCDFAEKIEHFVSNL